jgi:hypothetical protein
MRLAQNPEYQPQSPFGRTATGGPILRKQSAMYDVGRCIQYGICPGGGGAQTIGPTTAGTGATAAAAAGGKVLVLGPGAYPEIPYLTPGEQVSVGGSGLIPLQQQYAQSALEREISDVERSYQDPVRDFSEAAMQTPQALAPSAAFLPATPLQITPEMAIEEGQAPPSMMLEAPSGNGKPMPWLWIALGVGAVFLLGGTKGSRKRATL